MAGSKDDLGEKATHLVDSENQQAYLKWLTDAVINVQELMDTGRLELAPVGYASSPALAFGARFKALKSKRQFKIR